MIILLTIIFQILIMSVFCHGWNILLWDGMLFSKVRKWYDDKYNYMEDFDEGLILKPIPPLESFITIKPPSKFDRFLLFILKPVIGCVICFASVWGTVAFVGLKLIEAQYTGFAVISVPEWLICIICTVFVNYKLDK